MRATKCVCLLLCLALAVSTVAAAKSKKPLFIQDWLQQKQSSTSAKLAEYYYGDDDESSVEVSDVCMTEKEVKGCSCYERRGDRQCCWSANVDAEMACCASEAAPQYGRSLLAKSKHKKEPKEPPTTGKCSYTQSYLEEPVEVLADDTSVTKIGTFIGTCTLNKHAAACGDDDAGMTTVTVYGDILNATNVVFEGKPNMGKRSERCEQIFAGDCKVPRAGQNTSAPVGNSSSHGHTSWARSLLANIAQLGAPAAPAAAPAAAAPQASLQASSGIFMPAPGSSTPPQAATSSASSDQAGALLSALPFKYAKDGYQGKDRGSYDDRQQRDSYGRDSGYEGRREGPHESYGRDSHHEDDHHHQGHGYDSHHEDAHHHDGYGRDEHHKEGRYGHEEHEEDRAPYKRAYGGSEDKSDENDYYELNHKKVLYQAPKAKKSKHYKKDEDESDDESDEYSKADEESDDEEEEKPKKKSKKGGKKHKKYEDSDDEEEDDDGPKYYAGSALVFTGTFYSVNREHATAHDTGVYQAVQVEVYDDTTLSEAPEGSYVARPNEVYFRFVKAEKHYSGDEHEESPYSRQEGPRH